MTEFSEELFTVRTMETDECWIEYEWRQAQIPVQFLAVVWFIAAVVKFWF